MLGLAIASRDPGKQCPYLMAFTCWWDVTIHLIQRNLNDMGKRVEGTGASPLLRVPWAPFSILLLPSLAADS